MFCRLLVPAVSLAFWLALAVGSRGDDPQQRVEHLVTAAAHLQQAGCAEQAAQIRALISVEDLDVRLELLDRKTQELTELQTEIDQLRQTLTTLPQVLIQARLLSFQPEKLENLGIPLVSLRQLLDQPAATPVVDETGNLGRFLDMLQQQGFLKRIAEPTVVTVAGREVSYFCGGELPSARAAAPGTNAENESPEFGTRLRCLPRLDGEKIRLDLNFHHAALLPCQPDAKGAGESNSESAKERPTIPPAIAVIDVKTTIELASGQTVILSGMKQAKGNHAPSESALILVLKAEHVDSLSATPGRLVR